MNKMDINAIERAAAVARGPGASQMRAAARMLRAAVAAGVDLSGKRQAGELARDAINGSAGLARQKQLFDFRE